MENVSTLSSSNNLHDDEVINPLQQHDTNSVSNNNDTTNNQEQQSHQQDQLTKITTLLYETPIVMTTELSVKAKELQMKTMQRLQQAAEKITFTTTNKNLFTSNVNVDILEQYNKNDLQILLNKKIDITNQSIINVNYFPSIVQHYTGIEEIYVLFEMVHVNCIFVTTDEKVLEGMIDKEHLLNILRSKK